jgi:hypothetical protein
MKDERRIETMNNKTNNANLSMACLVEMRSISSAASNDLVSTAWRCFPLHMFVHLSNEMMKVRNLKQLVIIKKQKEKE